MDSETLRDLPRSRVMKTTAGSTGSNIVATVQSNTQRPGLLTIANELRNNIYELVFASDGTEPVYLLTAKPPSKAVALVSRQTCVEAKQMYNKAYREYWSLTTFYVDFNDCNSEPVTADHCTAADLANIRNLHLKLKITSTHLERQTQLERCVGSLASELVKGSSAVMFARQSDGRWWPSTEIDTPSAYVLCWEIRGSYRSLRYDRYDRAYYEQSEVFSPISLQELCAIGGRTFVMK
ncbi:hypothetical protein LTR17_002173 [Elasticomyces elasticus]|nr:hypothetical protein LTR17_002173 [Elasticomyces elasticus]